MLQHNYFKPLKFTVRGFFFWDIYLPHPKTFFFKEESQFKVERSTHFIRQWNWETCFFVFQLAGDGFNLHSAISDQTSGGMENFYTPEKFTNRYQTWCWTWKMHIPPFKLYVSFRISLGWKTRKPIHLPKKTLFCKHACRLPNERDWTVATGAFAGQWRAVEIAGCLSEATRGANEWLSCRVGPHKPFMDPLWRVIKNPTSLSACVVLKHISPTKRSSQFFLVVEYFVCGFPLTNRRLWNIWKSPPCLIGSTQIFHPPGPPDIFFAFSWGMATSHPETLFALFGGGFCWEVLERFGGLGSCRIFFGLVKQNFVGFFCVFLCSLKMARHQKKAQVFSNKGGMKAAKVFL